MPSRAVPLLQAQPPALLLLRARVQSPVDFLRAHRGGEVGAQVQGGRRRGTEVVLGKGAAARGGGIFRWPHLAGVQPVVEFLLALDAGQDQAVEDVLAQRGEQRAAEPDAEQYKEPREVVDTHLQGLRGQGGGSRAVGGGSEPRPAPPGPRARPPAPR